MGGLENRGRFSQLHFARKKEFLIPWLIIGLIFFLSDFLRPGLGGSIYGLVADSITRTPVASAQVEIDIGYTVLKTKTLPNGYYSTFAPEGKNYVLKVSKNGFETTVRRGIRVRANDFTEYNIDLKNKNHKLSRAAFKAANGKYVCADEGRKGRVAADRTSIGPWETFTYIRK